MGRFLICFLFGIFLIGALADGDLETSSTSSTTSTTAPSTSTSSSTSTTTSTTASPPTTSSTTATSTTTSPPTTSPSTTSSTTESTTTSSTTSAPPPDKDEFYRVTKDNITCIMFSGDIKFTVTYPLKDKDKSNTTTVTVPKANDKDSKVSSNGSCAPEEQYLVIQWGPSNTTLSNLRLLFNSTGGKWELILTQANLYVDEINFHNSSDLGSTLVIDGGFPGLSHVAVDTNSSLTCRAQIESKNFSAKVDSSESKFEVTGSAVGLELQAFNSVPNTSTLQQGMRCDADITSDLVPIAVGCALAGLVLLVLISYLVGRRRRSAAYQSV